MVRLLQKHGNSMALVFDKTMLETLNITPDSPLQITFTEGVMVVAPTQPGIAAGELDEAIAELRPMYKPMLENLAK